MFSHAPSICNHGAHGLGNRGLWGITFCGVLLDKALVCAQHFETFILKILPKGPLKSWQVDTKSVHCNVEDIRPGLMGGLQMTGAWLRCRS